MLPFLMVTPTLPYGMPPEGVDVLWRCEAHTYSVVIDPDREEYGSTSPKLELRWYRIARRTPKGAWLESRDHGMLERFVRLTAYSRFAANTRREAIDDFRERRNRQHYILVKQLERCEYELELGRRAAIEARGSDY